MSEEEDNLRAILHSPSYTLAEQDTRFLARRELRPVRMQLELLKPEMAFTEQNINTTIVVFGSTTILDRERSVKRLETARSALAGSPSDQRLARRVARAERLLAKSRYYDDAREFARLVSTRGQLDGKRDFVVVTGGGPGIMEAANRGAYDVGAKSIGLNITLPAEQAPNPYVTPALCFQFHYFALRKLHFLLRAQALVVFPGGFGTLDEFFDAITLRQTRRMQEIPIIMYGREYWERVVDFQFLADEGVIEDDHLKLIDYAETPEEAWDIITRFHNTETTPESGRRSFQHFLIRMQPSELDVCYMTRALALATRGRGSVEPNPMVGCTVVANGQLVGEGWHQRFGDAHAEIEALRVAGGRAEGATLYVTLEPCCHTGKTPPCTQSILRAGIGRVVVALQDPFPEVAGRGIAELRTAGVAVEVGLLDAEARRLNAPYLKLLATGRPFVIAKWAMTLDGKIATRAGDSRWISSEAAREIVHRLRGRVDAILVGRGTAAADDPLLTARPVGPRTATRIVLDSQATLSPDSQLARTARLAPVLVAVGAAAPAENQRRLAEAGCDLLVCPGNSRAARLDWLFLELGRRRITNLLVEGGAELLGSLFDARAIDEVHVFIAPKLIGGGDAPGAIAGEGLARMADALQLEFAEREFCGPDIHISGRVRGSA